MMWVPLVNFLGYEWKFSKFHLKDIAIHQLKNVMWVPPVNFLVYEWKFSKFYLKDLLHIAWL